MRLQASRGFARARRWGMEGGWYWLGGSSGVPPPAGKRGLGYTGLRTLDGPLAMTDDELKALVARIAESQDRADARQAKIDARQAKIDAQLAENAAQQAKTDAQLAKTDAQLAKTDAQLAKTDAQLAKTDAKLNRLAEMYGGLGNSLGQAAEEFFFNSLDADPVLGGGRFDVVTKNFRRKRAGLEDEFDLVLANGREVLVVEVKYKAHENDLRRLLDKKAPNFRRLFLEYADHEQGLALASFRVHDELKQAALERGVTVLQRKGDVIETIAA